MTRTQVQLPDQLYRDLKALAERHEWSLAEAIRRGAELLLRSYPSTPTDPRAWQLPEPADLGDLLIPVDRWREVANDREP